MNFKRTKTDPVNTTTVIDYRVRWVRPRQWDLRTNSISISILYRVTLC